MAKLNAYKMLNYATFKLQDGYGRHFVEKQIQSQEWLLIRE